MAQQPIVVDGGRVAMIQPKAGALGWWSIDDCCVMHQPAGDALRAAYAAGDEVPVIFWHAGAQYVGRVLVVAVPDRWRLLGFWLRGTGAPKKQ